MKLSDIPKRWRYKNAETLRFEARLAELDGRRAQAKKYNKYAQLLDLMWLEMNDRLLRSKVTDLVSGPDHA